MATGIDSAQPTNSGDRRRAKRITDIVPAIPFALTRRPRPVQSTTPKEQSSQPLLVDDAAPGLIDHTSIIRDAEHKENKAQEPTPEEPKNGVLQTAIGEEVVPKEPATDKSSAAEEGPGPTENIIDPHVEEPVTPKAAADEWPRHANGVVDSAQESLQLSSEAEPINHFEPNEYEGTVTSNGAVKHTQLTAFDPNHELPPPFYPFSQRGTSSSSYSQPPSVQNLPFYHPRPSASTIVFGEATESSGSSPVSQSVAATAAQLQPPPPPAPGLPDVVYGRQHPILHENTQGHIPMSEFHLPLVYNTPPNPPAFGSRGVPPHPANLGYFRDGTFHNQTLQYPSASSPVETQGFQQQHAYGDVESSSSSTGAVQQPLSQNHISDSAIGSLSSHTSLSETRSPANLDPSGSLVQFLVAQFGNRRFADYVIDLTHAYHYFPPAHIPVHRLLIARSPTLLSLMVSVDFDPRLSSRLLRVSVADDFTNVFAFTEALKYLYGLPLLDRAALLSNIPPLDFESASSGPAPGFSAANDRMAYVLGYAVSGFLLQLDQVVMHGVELAERLLRWDTLELGLAFALDGSLTAAWAIEGVQHAGTSLPNGLSVLPEQLPAPQFGTYATRILESIIRFLTLNFPQDFEFDSSAVQLRSVPRLPFTVDTRPSASNPRMSHIRFGEIPLDAPITNHVNSMLSSVLLSLPFQVLQRVLDSSDLEDRTGSTHLSAIRQKIIEERETRRQKAINGRIVPSYNQALDEALWRNTAWVEKLQPTGGEDGAGLRLVREREAIQAPDSAVSGVS